MNITGLQITVLSLASLLPSAFEPSRSFQSEINGTSWKESQSEERWKVYEESDSKVVALEVQSLARRCPPDYAENHCSAEVPYEKSPVRVGSTPLLTLTTNSSDQAPPQVMTISRLSIGHGARYTMVNKIGHGKWRTLYSQRGKSNITIKPLDPLPPGEYMVTLKAGEELGEGDEVFLFGVD